MHFYENFNLSENLANLSENGEQGNKAKAKQRSWCLKPKKIFVFKWNVYSSDLSCVFMDEMNLLY